ncbi:zinc finger, CCHC-type containing protein [Tanacetum coccineum]
MRSDSRYGIVPIGITEHFLPLMQVEEEAGEWIRFFRCNSSSGTKKYRGSNSSDDGNTRDGVKIAGGVIGSGDEIDENTGGIILSLEFSEELKELLPDEALGNNPMRPKINIVNNNIGSSFMSTSKLNDSILWHARLGHVHFKRMQDMSKDGLIPALDMDTEKDLCDLQVTEEVVKQPEPKLRKCKRNRTPKEFKPEFQLSLIEGTRDKVSDQHSYCFNVEDDPKTFDEAMKSLTKRLMNAIAIKLQSNYSLESDVEELILDPANLMNSVTDHHLAYSMMALLSLALTIVLKKFNYFDFSLVSTSMDTIEKLMPNNGQAVSQLEFSRVISFLLYAITCTRPDIAFDVGKLGRLMYTGYPSMLEDYTDACWIINTEENSSTSGWVFLLGGGAISWASKKQTCITSSTMELEFSTDQVQVDLTKEFLSSMFSIKDMGEANVILGIRIKHESNGIAIPQSYYIEKVLKKFNYFDCTPVITPMDTSKKMMPNNGQAVSQLEYFMMIGYLMYVMTCTWPDIAFEVGKLSRYTSNPGTQYWQVIQRVFLLGRGAISWASKKQTCITSLIIDSEFMALAAAIKKAGDVQWIFEEHVFTFIPKICVDKCNQVLKWVEGFNSLNLDLRAGILNCTKSRMIVGNLVQLWVQFIPGNGDGVTLGIKDNSPSGGFQLRLKGLPSGSNPSEEVSLADNIINELFSLNLIGL